MTETVQKASVPAILAALDSAIEQAAAAPDGTVQVTWHWLIYARDAIATAPDPVDTASCFAQFEQERTALLARSARWKRIARGLRHRLLMARRLIDFAESDARCERALRERDKGESDLFAMDLQDEIERLKLENHTVRHTHRKAMDRVRFMPWSDLTPTEEAALRRPELNHPDYPAWERGWMDAMLLFRARQHAALGVNDAPAPAPAAEARA